MSDDFNSVHQRLQQQLLKCEEAEAPSHLRPLIPGLRCAIYIVNQMRNAPCCCQDHGGGGICHHCERHGEVLVEG